MRRRPQVLMKAALARLVVGAANGALTAAAVLMWPRKRPRGVRRLCIHRVGRIGDIVCAIPAMRTIRAEYPGAEIVLLTSAGPAGFAGAGELLSGARWIDRILRYHPKEVRSLSGMAGFIRSLRAERFDAWIELSQGLAFPLNEMRNMAFVRLLGIPWAGGFRIGSTSLFAKATARAGELRPEWERLTGDLGRMGFGAVPSEEPLSPGGGDVEAAARLLGDGKEALLGVAPGAGRPANRWMPERFAEVARRWTAAGGRVVIVGGAGDEAAAGEVERACGGSAVNACGAATPLQSAELLRRCRAAVTNDSGPMHLAAAMMTPCVVPFSARDFPGKWRPRGDRHAIFRREVDCSPCFLDECPRGNLCLAGIGVEEIWREVQRFLPGGTGSGA